VTMFDNSRPPFFILYSILSDGSGLCEKNAHYREGTCSIAYVDLILGFIYFCVYKERQKIV